MLSAPGRVLAEASYRPLDLPCWCPLPLLCCTTRDENLMVPPAPSTFHHLCNGAGTMGREELRLLRDVSVSQGLMLEATSRRLLEPGGPHFNCPDKVQLLQ